MERYWCWSDWWGWWPCWSSSFYFNKQRKEHIKCVSLFGNFNYLDSSLFIMFICISRPSAQNVSSTRPRVIRNQLTEDDNEVLPLLPHQGNATQTEGNHCVIYVIIVFHFLKLLLNLQIHLCNLNLVLLVVLRVRLRVRRTQNPGFGNMCLWLTRNTSVHIVKKAMLKMAQVSFRGNWGTNTTKSWKIWNHSNVHWRPQEKWSRHSNSRYVISRLISLLIVQLIKIIYIFFLLFSLIWKNHTNFFCNSLYQIAILSPWVKNMHSNYLLPVCSRCTSHWVEPKWKIGWWKLLSSQETKLLGSLKIPK